MTMAVAAQPLDVQSNASTAPGFPSWDEFLVWARAENEHQRRLVGAHYADPDLRGRTYFEVNLYRYYATLKLAWPYLQTPQPKILDVGSWPGVWLRVLKQFIGQRNPQIWATGLIFPQNFMEVMNGACDGTMKCELDPWSPLAEKDAPNELTQRGFTFVSAMEVVEHLYHPGWMFQVLADAMAPGGILLMTTNNIARLQNMLDLLRGGGLSGNLEQLVPIGGGSTGAWRPHMREYAWMELNHLALQAGFEYVAHAFFEDNYGKRLLTGQDAIELELQIPADVPAGLVAALDPLLHERAQLLPAMCLVLRRSGIPGQRFATPTETRPPPDLERRVAAMEEVIRELLNQNHHHITTFAEMTRQNQARDQAIAVLSSQLEDLRRRGVRVPHSVAAALGLNRPK